MVMGLIIFITKHIGANEDALLKLFPQIGNDETGEILKLIQDLNFISQFDSFGKFYQMLMWFIFIVEIAFYVFMFYRWLPKYISSLKGRGAKVTARQLQRFKNIEEKRQLGARLTSRETKWYRKHKAVVTPPTKSGDN